MEDTDRTLKIESYLTSRAVEKKEKDKNSGIISLVDTEEEFLNKKEQPQKEDNYQVEVYKSKGAIAFRAE